MPYWPTNTAGSAARIHYETAFRNELARPIRSIAEWMHTIVHWSKLDRGGHFAAMEAPNLLLGDIQTFFRRLR